MKYLSIIIWISVLACSSEPKSIQTTSASEDYVDDYGACDEEGRVICPFYYTPGVEGLAPEADWAEQAAALGYSTASAKLSLLSCLEANSESLSQECKDSLERRDQLNEEMMNACLSYCAEAGIVTAPGNDPCVDYLVSIEAQLDATCKAALDAHEAAKP